MIGVRGQILWLGAETLGDLYMQSVPIVDVEDAVYSRTDRADLVFRPFGTKKESRISY